MSLFLRQASVQAHACPQPSTLTRCLAPSTTPKSSRRSFFSSPRSRSRIGRAPIAIPEGVQVSILEPKVVSGDVPARRSAPPRIVQVDGPLGMRLLNTSCLAQRILTSIPQANSPCPFQHLCKLHTTARERSWPLRSWTERFENSESYGVSNSARSRGYCMADDITQGPHEQEYTITYWA